MKNSWSLTTLFDILGYYGPIFLFVFVILQMHTSYYAVVFSVGYILNYILNEILKNLIREPRPDNPVPYDFLSKENKNVQSRGYGMPSGHVQMVAFASTFYALYHKFHNVFYTIFAFWLVFITAYQRVKYRRHTILQTMYGAAIGALFAYIIYVISKKSGV